MKVQGKHEFNVNKKQLWDYLMDPEVLAKITPGVTTLEVLGDDKYKSVSDIKIGPVKGSFKGKLEVTEKNEPESFAIIMEQLSTIGNAHVKIDMQLEDGETENSALAFNGNAKLSGMIARTGQRVLSGVANTLTKEVFASLEKHIEEDIALTQSPTPTEESTQVETAPTSTNPAPSSEGFWSSIIAFFKKLFGAS